MSSGSRTHVLVLAKEPLPGRVKTRLCPPFSPEGAALLAEAALADTLEAVADSGAERRVLALDGEAGPWLPAGFEIIRQVAGPFDVRLAAAWETTGGPGIQIGMDTPQVTPELLDLSLGALLSDGVDAVLGDAEDGGWWAIGLRRSDPRVFLGVPMSTPQTGAAQRARLRELDLSVAPLRRLRDLDTAADADAIARAAPLDADRPRLRRHHGVRPMSRQARPIPPLAGAADHPAEIGHAAHADPPAPEVDVVLPVLNEVQAIPWVLGRMPEGLRPIVVDNGSTDGSADAAHQHGAVVVTEPRRGFGSACFAGLSAANAPIVCFMDCDGSLDPADLHRLIQPIHNGRADMVLGARQPDPGAWPLHARLANRWLAHQIARRLGCRLSDVGPMRAARRADLLALDLEDRRSGWPLEMVLRAGAEGWHITELPVRYRARHGRSKVTGSLRGTIQAVHDMHGQLRAAPACTQ